LKNMRKRYVIIGAVGLLATPNLFATITMMDNASEYSAGDGGEFRAVVTDSFVDWTSYSPLTQGTVGSASYDSSSWGYSSGLNGKAYFQTFCTELNEEFSPGATYNISSVGNAALYNNQYDSSGNGIPVPLDLGVAYLYSQFAGGTLASYDYTYGGGRSATAGDLQNAIWILLGEESGTIATWVQNDLATGLHTTAGNLAAWRTVAPSGDYGVSVMVLDKPGGAQDQLVMTGPGVPQSVPVPEASTVFAGALLLLPLGASAIRIVRKNRLV
jgi:hypothetical protein